MLGAEVIVVVVVVAVLFAVVVVVVFVVVVVVLFAVVVDDVVVSVFRWHEKITFVSRVTRIYLNLLLSLFLFSFLSF